MAWTGISNVVAIATKSDIMSAMLIHAIANIRPDDVAYEPNPDIDNILVELIINHLSLLMILTRENGRLYRRVVSGTATVGHPHVAHHNKP